MGVFAFHSPDEPGGLAIAYALSGNRTESEKILAGLLQRSQESYIPPALIASIHVALGNSDRAFEYLDVAIRERDPILIFLEVDPYFEPLHPDPRFAELLKRLGLQ